MRGEKEMMELILHTAREDVRIRAAYMGGLSVQSPSAQGYFSGLRHSLCGRGNGILSEGSPLDRPFRREALYAVSGRQFVLSFR